MDNSVVNEKSGAFDPGAASYGNFINYYSFHPPEDRIRLLPNFMEFVRTDTSNQDIICLDVGCNTGELTQEVQRFMTKLVGGLSKSRILGIDLDEVLIERANEMNHNERITFKAVDVLTEDFKTVYNDYLKQYDKPNFDIVFCFSITMWIHLNYGDEGLKRFIISLSDIADMFVVEPQPWRCYAKAVRRIKRSKCEPIHQFDQLKIRKDVEDYIDSVLTEQCNFVKVLQTAPTKWGRQIRFYKRKM